MVPFETIWKRVVALEGETFTQVRGGTFMFTLVGTTLQLDRTNQNLPRSQLEEASKSLPFSSTQDIQHLRAPSYIYAILMDRRVRGTDW